MLPAQGAELEAEAARLHLLHRGQTPAEAELNFLNRAKFSDYYGVRLYPALVRTFASSITIIIIDLEVAPTIAALCIASYPVLQDRNQRQVHVGVSSGGISVFDGHARVDGFLWARILKLSFKRNLFYVQLKTEVRAALLTFVNCTRTVLILIVIDRCNREFH